MGEARTTEHEWQDSRPGKQEGGWIVFFLTPVPRRVRWTLSRTGHILGALALAFAASQTTAAGPDPEPPPDRAKPLEKIAKAMDDLAKRLKDGSLGPDTQRLHERVLADLGEAMRREKAAAAKAEERKDRAEMARVAAGLEQARATQERLGQSMKRLGRLGRLGEGKERDAALADLSQEQAKAAQMVRDIAARVKPAK